MVPGQAIQESEMPDISAAGPSFELLSRIALDAAQERYPGFGVGNVERGRLG
jgi:hypothetical protein